MRTSLTIVFKISCLCGKTVKTNMSNKYRHIHTIAFIIIVELSETTKGKCEFKNVVIFMTLDTLTIITK